MKAEDWIKVEDRLPEERQAVMIRFWNGVVHTGSLINGKWHANWNDYDIDFASHWIEIIHPKE